MAMSASSMADLIVDNLKALNPGITGDVETRIHQRWQAVCQGIIDHVKTNMDILPASHGSTPLKNDVGQPVHVSLGTGDGTTTLAQTIIGKGSAE